jgi:signal transduction histidine kinase/CheY-like chemotaxis protein
VPIAADDLRQEVTATIALALIAVAGAAWLSVGPGPAFSWWRILVYFSLVVQGSFIYWASSKHLRLAHAMLAVGPALSLALAMRVIPSPAVSYYAVLSVMAASAVSMPLGLGAALLNTVALEASSPTREHLLSALALIWLAAVLQWISGRGRKTLLQWAWDSQQRATRLLEEVRNRQGRLNRALHAMDEANARLALANERLAEARRTADEARQAKARFAVNVSHELRTPLNVIVGFVEVMHNSPRAYPGVSLSPQFLVDLGAVYRNAQHLQKLVDDVLDLAQLEAGRFVLQAVETDLVAVIEEAVATIHNLAAVRGLAIVASVNSSLPRVYVDRTRIKQVLLNLLSNAIRYTEAGTITVTAGSDDREVWCAVADTGPGIPEEQQLRLFEEFERLNRGPGSSHEGSGLGLAISKHLVQEHGGRIWAQSQLGFGSTFTFALPIVGEELPQRTAHASTRLVPESLTSERDPVLLLTPSLSAARLFSRHFASYRCLSTSDLQQAIRQIAAFQPRGIVVDAALGPEAVTEVSRAAERASIPNIPVVVCPLPDPAQMQGLAAVKGYLTKPVTRRDLLATLRTLGGEIETILAVDDEEDVLRLFTHYLEDDQSRPYRVLTARDGREALEVIGREHTDLVLLDLVMPTMSGYQFLDEMRQMPGMATLPVVVISGQDFPAKQLPVEGWLEMRMPKGMAVDQLIRGVERLFMAMEGARQGQGG